MIDKSHQMNAISYMPKNSKEVFSTRICSTVVAGVRAKSKRTGVKISRITEDALKKEVEAK